jgi:acetyltransferase-like isoleucine patch superfamily enzyme
LRIVNVLRKVRIFFIRVACFLPGNELRCGFYKLGGIKIGKKTYIARNVRIGRGAIIGNGVKIYHFSTLNSGVLIGDNVEVRRNVTIGNDVKIGNNVVVGENSLVANAIIGKGSFIEYGVVFTGVGHNRIIIGNDCYIGIYAVLNWCGGIEIGDCVHIAGPSVGLWTHSSTLDCLSSHELHDHSYRKVAGIKIENNVWIGGNSTIYPGVTIGHHSVILPNSAVNQQVLPMTVLGGVPGRVIGKTLNLMKGEKLPEDIIHERT